MDKKGKKCKKCKKCKKEVIEYLSSKGYDRMVDKIIRTLRVPYNLIEDCKGEAKLTVLKKYRKYDDGLSQWERWCYYQIFYRLQQFVIKDIYPFGGSMNTLKKANHKNNTWGQMRDISLYPNLVESNTANLNNIDLDRLRMIFIRHVQLKFTPKEVSIITDYFLKSLGVNKLKQKYGCYGMILRNILGKMDGIIEDIRYEYNNE